MIITTNVSMDLQRPGYPVTVNAVQGDENTRQLAVSLYSDGAAWDVPENVTVAMRYCKPDRTKGYYDTMPDGSSAWSASGNVVNILLAPQMLTVSGTVMAQMELVQGSQVLGTFMMTVRVEYNPAAGVLESEDYVSWLQWMTGELEKRTPVRGVDYYTEQDKAEFMDDLLACADAIPIINSASGSEIQLTDSTDLKLRGLTIYGKTTQDGTPSPDNPVPLVSPGDSGVLNTYVGDQVLPISTPNGLPGIPVTSGGNYTDENGQQWICDEVDSTRSVYVQRVRTVTFTGEEAWIDLFPAATTPVRPYYSRGYDNGRDTKSNYFAEAFTSNSDYVGIRNLDGEGFENITNFIEFVKQKYADGSPVELMYILKTPIETPLSESELAAYAALHTNYPNTTIYNDGGAGMKVSYVADTKAYIDNKFNALSAAILNNA